MITKRDEGEDEESIDDNAFRDGIVFSCSIMGVFGIGDDILKLSRNH